MSSHDEMPVLDDDYVAKKQKAVTTLLNVVAYGSAEVSRTPEDSALRLMLARCMEMLGRAEVELAEATRDAGGSKDVASLRKGTLAAITRSRGFFDPIPPRHIPFVADCRSFDIPETIAAMIRNAAPNCVAVTLSPRGGLGMVRAAEHAARKRGMRILWWNYKLSSIDEVNKSVMRGSEGSAAE